VVGWCRKHHEIKEEVDCCEHFKPRDTLKFIIKEKSDRACIFCVYFDTWEDEED